MPLDEFRRSCESGSMQGSVLRTDVFRRPEGGRGFRLVVPSVVFFLTFGLVLVINHIFMHSFLFSLLLCVNL